jgi:transcriptional repressor NrdR
LECGSRFTTFERVHLRDFIVVKKDGNREPFDRDKLVRSVSSAMHKHSLDTQKIERVVTSVVRQCETSGETEISSKIIGQMVMRSLFNMDAVAYVRFASIYKEFENAQDFIDFISSMNENDTNLENENLFDHPDDDLENNSKPID